MQLILLPSLHEAGPTQKALLPPRLLRQQGLIHGPE